MIRITKIELDIFISPEGKGKNKIYSARSLQIPNVVTQGKTIEEARERLKEALNLYFEEEPSEKKKVITTIESTKENSAPLISKIFL